MGTAKPRFQEPIFLVEIQTPDDAVGGIYNCLSQRRGIVQGEEPISGTPLVMIKAYLPVAESLVSLRLSVPPPLVVPSHSACSIIGSSSVVILMMPTPKVVRSSLTPERERVSRKVFPASTTSSTSSDLLLNNFS